MEDLYLHIYNIQNVPAHPEGDPFSYGLLLVQDGEPVACFRLDDDSDNKFQFLMSNGRIFIQSAGGEDVQLYYGYATEEMLFYCEQKVFPPEEPGA